MGPFAHLGCKKVSHIWYCRTQEKLGNVFWGVILHIPMLGEINISAKDNFSHFFIQSWHLTEIFISPSMGICKMTPQNTFPNFSRLRRYQMCDTFLQPRWAKGPIFQRAPLGFHRSFTYLPHIRAPGKCQGSITTPQVTPFWKEDTPRYSVRGMASS